MEMEQEEIIPIEKPKINEKLKNKKKKEIKKEKK